MDYFKLDGKVALVTGGGTGIGSSIALALAEAGASVAVAGRRLEKCEETCEEIKKKTGAKMLPVACDVTQMLDISSMVQTVQLRLGDIDILVNNAGISGNLKPILEMSMDDWDSVIDTNLKSAFTLSKMVAGAMKERGEGGKIINISSILSSIGSPLLSSYCASKGGLTQLTKVMALEWARYNIQVNAILPGYIETPINEDYLKTEKGQKLSTQQIPMRRVGKVEELRGVAILLASSASNFMTGSSVVVDGGQTCL